MQNETKTFEDKTSRIIPSSSWRVCNVRLLGSYRLYVKFVDGLEGVVDLSNLIMSENAGIFIILRDPGLLKSVYLNYGVVSWPGDLDLSPDAMYDEIKNKGGMGCQLTC